jgi:ribonuclease P protein component
MFSGVLLYIATLKAGHPFPKSRRITQRRDYLLCYRHGRRYFSADFLIYVRQRESDGQGSRLGTAVSKKIGKAVKRNRVKRLLKEFFRLHQHELCSDVDIVVVPKRHIKPDRLNFSQVEAQLSRVMTRVARELVQGGGT